ncbi:MAG: apolipoprotein N-acyltransferase [Sulfurimonas sp. RIFCSPHIGHO2_12_FULL_36_9]|uniref:apolipoprotein N-acyltransferase n=1 Tax=Sulfurimonas sp. RIFCSPLOWO2_12_36_12 TaxID=1802253 RepID=UPI0008B8F71C|nr:apolipoprotein N-acyltransferase [Sulfurimonas sp. RIFCSPLOWO2_12_36_12]OHD96481.1 MAG: apolipoprotein N-acyltransferase [Sulfurimonas sp. RIFCSPHIGHO2_12_FULL_36_9]OHD99490.1 MAG: apolipoprotein N-acyltransferase [Sulfurimonas sp. RIFCSPLOWO2_02_FULL_36_28]OHE00405.1 MAG: apolipoprotein N-acyltransferase [Sulfurimonas sp. RIFCSPLOWO2_12_36_12]OHE07453.1 MAG: apolipoprotein N-acyltransferase [Sulfurimonas sp. RIFCSPLOWO2_12_FULL_36_74]
MIEKIQNIRNSYNHLLFDLTLGVITALLFSAFLYLEHFGITIKLLNTIFGLFALALLLYIPKRAVLTAGFFIGLLWFYWIGYSFKYNGINNMETLITVAFMFIYMLFFGVLALTNSVAIRAVLLFGLTFFEPVDFNWLQPEILFVDSYIGVLKYQFATVLLSLSLVNYIKNPYRYASLLLLILAFNFNPPIQKDAPLKIKLVATDITQDVKWKRDTLNETLQIIYQEIESATENGYDIVVLPESVFPFFMNESPLVIEHLKTLSYDIAIVAGSLLREENLHYNVTYKFENGDFDVAKKMILVPFGEYIPLPKFAEKFVNDIFFAGASDFKTATKPTDFIIKGIKFRNAICYEATRKEIYEGDVDFVIATSNNAWFYPSIEPTLQKLLIRFYARKNGTTVYHSANWSGTGIIK